MAGALDGLEVLDLSWGIAGPITTMLLADSGARVTRIERPGGDPAPEPTGAVVWHRGKRSAVLDLATTTDHAAFARLAARADVVVDSFAPGTAARLGVDHATLVAANPRLISCSITGYGRDNRHADRPAWDALVAARTGLLYDQKGRTGHRARLHPRPPRSRTRSSARPRGWCGAPTARAGVPPLHLAQPRCRLPGLARGHARRCGPGR